MLLAAFLMYWTNGDDVMKMLIIAFLMHWTHGDDALLTTELLISNAGE